MLSVKVIEDRDFGKHFSESIFSAESVRYIPGSPSDKRDHLLEIYNDNKVTDRVDSGMVYVMGDGGATVAKYNLDMFGPNGLRYSEDESVKGPLPPNHPAPKAKR